ncbi:MAG: penicillin-binding transpeptidase domain-containing protein [Mobilitalea sp.]
MEKAYGKTNRSFTSRMQARLLLVFCVISLLLVGLMGRLIYITQVDGDRYTKQVLSRQSYTSAVLPYKRGSITDRNGTILAQSVLMYRLILDPLRLNENPKAQAPTMKALQDYFEITEATVQDILNTKPKSQYVTMLKNLDYDLVQTFKDYMKENEDILGVNFEEEYVRNYPFSTLASDVLGFTSADNTGFWGLEEYYNDELNGTNGREYGYYDANLNIERIVKKAVNGNTVVSTIDANVQRIIQEKIVEFNTEFGSKNIEVLLMNPNNGEILGMASNQEYDLNNPQDLSGIYSEEEIASMTAEQKTEVLNALWKNDVISSGFEPGSTFKPITIAAALEENLSEPEHTYICDGGEWVGGIYIHCNKRAGHGEITLGEALMYSCNDALMQIVAEEGKDIFYQYETALGFGKTTGIDLPGEAAGIIHAYDKLNPTELATSSFGQTFDSTMLQLASAFSSLVNGGNYYKPHAVKKIVNDSGVTVKEMEPVLVRQTVSSKTSDFIQEYMYQTVENGTAGGAKVEGYAVGGKTGTAQKHPVESKTYIVSFLGCVPAINPEVVIYVMIDEPQNVEKQADSSIATKFASKILKEILPALGIFPDGEIDYLLDPANSAETTTDPNSENTNGENGQTTEGNNEQPAAEETETGDNSSEETIEQGSENGLEGNNPENNPLEDEFNPDAID